MDDKGLLNKPQDDKPTDDDQKKIDEALGKLPDKPNASTLSGDPSTSPSTTSSGSSGSGRAPLPPPSIPSMPPMAAGATPPPTPPVGDDPAKLMPRDDKPIPTEEPKTKKPKRRLGKNAKKIVGGMLVLALLVGGVVVGRNVVQERQVVESEASIDYKICEYQTKESDCTGCSSSSTWEKGWRCKWKDGACKAIIKNNCARKKDDDKDSGGCSNYNWSWSQIDGSCSIFYCPGEFSCSTCNTGLGDISKAKVKSGNFCGLVQIDCPGKGDDGQTNKYIEIWSDQGCESPESSPTPIPTPSPTPSPSPSPTPSPGPELSCVDLSSNTDPIEHGDTVTFTCEGSFSSVTAPVAYFRYSVDSGTYTTSAAVTVDLVSNTANYDIDVNEYGDWNVQCRVCEDDAAASCTTWGEANGSGGSIPAPGTLGGMCGGIAGILCEGELACDIPNQDRLDLQPDASGTCIEEQRR